MKSVNAAFDKSCLLRCYRWVFHVFVLYSHSWSLVVTCVLLDTILTIWFSLDHKLYASDYDLTWDQAFFFSSLFLWLESLPWETERDNRERAWSQANYDSDYVASENQPLEQSLESLSAVYAASLHFLPLLTQYLFSACAMQPDLRVIRSCSQQKSLNFSGRARDTGKLKKQGNFWLPRKIRKEWATEFITLARPFPIAFVKSLKSAGKNG